MSSAYQAVFLSYASQDAEAAKRICDALRAAGVEVWFDQSELVGGDQWDGKIRGQISSCALFVPIISANTQARLEGYFRIEWKLAARRTHAMATAKAFLLPIVIDETHDALAHVPDEFREVQWTRLKGGETPVAFAERVRKLLKGEQGAGSREQETVEGTLRPDSSEPSGRKAPPTLGSKPWLWPVILGSVAIAIATVWLTRKHEPSAAAEPSARRSAPTTMETVAAPLTEAQKLVAKARTILEQGDELNRETYALAEELLIKAEALDVTEASAWVLHAKVSVSRIGYGLDHSPARYEALRTQAGRAIQLTPDSLDAQLAECDSFIIFEQDIPGVVTRLQALAAKYPDDWRVPEKLSACYRLLGKLEEARAANDRAMQLSLDNPRLKSNQINLLVFAGHWAEADAAMATMLQGRTGARLLAHNVYLKLMWSGDLAGAATAVRSWPAWFLLEDRGVGHAALVALWNRDPGSALEVVRKFPRDYIRDFLFTGPSAVLSAWANEQAGNVESARADWRVVQQVAERELQSTPNDQFALHWKAWALARLGDTPAATSILQQLLEKNLSMSAMGQVVGRLGALAHTVGRTDLALVQIALNPPGSRAITKTDLRLNPLFDPLRSDPRFQAVIEAAPGPVPVAQRTEDGGQKTAPAADSKSVAVLAFRQLSSDPENEYLSEAISDELCNVLGRVPGLKVAASASAFTFKGKRVRPSEMAAQLGVAYLVDGTVQKNGNRVRVTATLIKAADESPVWRSGTLDHEAKDLFAVQDDVVSAIAKNLQLQLGAGGAKTAVTINPEALRLYFEGRRAWSQWGTADARARAEKLFKQAIALDPGLGRAYAGLADVSLAQDVTLSRYGNRDSAPMREIQALTAQALAYEPDSADAHATRGRALWEAWRVGESERALRAAIRLNPSYADAHTCLGGLLMADGRVEEALAEHRLAVQLDPLIGMSFIRYGNALNGAGRLGDALVQLERGLALFPDSAFGLLSKMSVLTVLGRHEEALALARGLGILRSQGKVETFAAAGQMKEAEEALATLDGAWNVRGHALLALGRQAEALAELSPEKVSILGVVGIFYSPLFDPIRADPRFVGVLATLGLTEAHDRAQAWRKAHPPEKPEARK